jgi:hypothetical protein
MEKGSTICHHIESGAQCFIVSFYPITVKPAFYTDDIGNGVGASVVLDSEIDFNKQFKQVKYNDMKTTGTINISGISEPIYASSSLYYGTPTTTGITGFTSDMDIWSTPERVEVNEVGETIEMIYKQTLSFNYWPAPPYEERVYKIVYSCIDGKWNKSEPIYGKIIPAQEEYFEFED